MKKWISVVLFCGLVLLSASTAMASDWHILGVILRPQQKSNTCWAASARMVLEFNGSVYDECSLVSYVWGVCVNNTATIDNIKSILSAKGSLTSTTGNWPLRFDEIQTYIGKSQPFIFRWAWSSGGGHFMVGSGWETDDSNQQWVHYEDPLPVNQGTYAKELYAYVRGGTGYNHTWTHSLYDIR